MMTRNSDVEPWKIDDTLVSALSVEWVAKNIFLVAVPSYRRKISCELTAVDVPRGTATALVSAITSVLERVNGAMRLYLRQDFYSNFPLEGYGDVIYSAESRAEKTATLQWRSLQETLTEVGVACVVRPSLVRQPALFGAEKAVSEGKAAAGASRLNDDTWLSQLQHRERSPLFCSVHRCVVEDVLRGDVYRVSWTSAEKDGASPDAVDLPKLLILDSTVCHSPSTEPGFAALRWAQTHLLHRELLVHIHAVYPSDKDVAHNTQLETYEHLANVRASASVLNGGGNKDVESTSHDVGVALVSCGLAWVRRVTDAGVPRASNLFSAFEAIEEAFTKGSKERADDDANDQKTRIPQKNPTVCAALAKMWSLPLSSAIGLLNFHGSAWCGALQQGQQSNEAASSSLGATRQLWQTFLWCGDLHQDPNDEPRVYRHRPLRTLFPLAGLAEHRVRLCGQVDGATLIESDEGRTFLQVEVTTVTPAAEWKELRRAVGYSDVSAVHFSPAPGDGVLGNEVRVVVRAAMFSDDVEARLRVSCRHYVAATFLLSQHSPSGEWVDKKGSEYESVLSLKGTSDKPTVFVLDVVVEGRDEHAMTWTQRGNGRAVYVLSPDVDSDAKGLVGNEDAGNDKIDTATANGVDADGIGESAKREIAAALAASLRFVSKLSVFFELNSSATERGHVSPSHLLPEVQKAFERLQYESVVVVPVGVVEVCGVRGLIGDLLFPKEDPPRATAYPLQSRPSLTFQRSLLTSIGWTWWANPPAPSAALPASAHICDASWPMTTAVYEAVQWSYCISLEKLTHDEWTARGSVLRDAEWEWQLLDREARNVLSVLRGLPLRCAFEDPPRPALSVVPPCLCYTAGAAVLWHDGSQRPRLRLPPAILPTTVPLSLFSVRPRELFSVAASQKMKTVNKPKDAPPLRTLLELSYEQQDFAFMRLHFPSLTNVLQCDWERLPLSLRNTERALCDSIARKKTAVPEPGMLYSTQRIFSLFMSYLALLQCMQCASAATKSSDANVCDAAVSALAAVYQSLDQCTPSIWDDCKSAMHFSATLFVLPPYRTDSLVIPHSRPLFLGSRDNIVSDVFEVPQSDNMSPEIVSFPILKELTVQCVSTVGVEALVEVAERDASVRRDTFTALDASIEPDAYRPMSLKGLPRHPLHATTPILYRPLPRLAVLAAPLVEREEYAPEALGRLRLDRDIFAGVRAEKAEDVLVRRRIGLQYRCIAKFAEKNPYQAMSYGRVSSVDMFKTLIADRARGKEIQDYMSLLLRREHLGKDGASAFPDGLLTVHGVPSEPLYVHYRSRADLRFTLSTICPPLRQALLQAETTSAEATEATDKVDEHLLQMYAEAASSFTRTIYERVRMAQRSEGAAQQISLAFTLQPSDGATPPYIAIQVFPVSAADSEAAERVLDHERVWQLPGRCPQNPHHAFSLYGSRFGRLALAELRIGYSVVEGRFDASWNAAFESGAAEPTSSH